MPNLPSDVLDAALNQSQRQDDERMAAQLEQQAAPVRQALFNAQVPDLGALLSGLTPMGPSAQPQATPAPQQTPQPQQPGFSFQMPSLNDLLGDLAPKPQPVATPSGTPAGMPSAPRTVDATITNGPRPDQQLRPGESVGNVTLGDGSSAQQPAPSGGDYGPIDNSSRQSFVRTAYPYMLEAAGGDRNLAELMLAKAISENGSIGTGKPFWANNFSGIKGVGDAGSVEADTWEDYGNGRVNIKDKFAAYSTPQKGMAAFMGFLRENSRYAPALQHYQQTGNADALFDDILAAGYATDKEWANKVRSIRDTQVAPYVRQQTADARQSLNAGSGSVPQEPAAPPQAAAGVPPASGGPDTQAMWSPDMPSEAERGQGAFQAATGRSGGSGVMQRAPLGDAAQYDPRDADSGPREATPYGPPLSEAGPEMPTSYNDPTDGGTISQPLPAPVPPSYTLADGRTEPPTPTGQWEPVQTIPNPQRPPAADPGQWLAEDSQSTPVQTAQPTRINTGRPFEPGLAYGPEDTAPPSPTMGTLIQGSQAGMPPELVDNSPEAQRRAEQQAARTLQPQPSVRPQPTYRQGPAEEAAAQIEAEQARGLAPTPPRWSLPGSSGRMLAEGVQESQRTGQPISPLTLYSAFSELPFDVYQAAYDRAVIAADRDISGTDPLAPFRGLGIALPSAEEVNPEGRPAAVVLAGLLMSGVLPDPTDPYVAAAFRGAGRAIGATGRRFAAEGRTIARGAEAVAEAAGPIWREGRETAARLNAEPGGGFFAPVSLGAGEIEQRAVKQFGTTDDVGSMGYVLRDGTGLDFSGGGAGRGLDHRSITSVIDGPTGTPGMRQFMGDTGAVRVSMNSGRELSIDIPNGLSPQQRNMLLEEARYAERVYLDITDPQTGENIASRAFTMPNERGALNQTIRKIPDHVVEAGEVARAAEQAAKAESADMLRSRIQFARDTLAGKFGPVDETARNYYTQSFRADQAKLRALEGGTLATAGPTPAMRGSGALTAANRVLSEGLAGGVGGAVIEQARNPDEDPRTAAARGFAVGAVGFPAATRAIRGVAGRAGTRVTAGTLGNLPEDAARLADSGPTPRSRMNMEDIASRAEEVLGVKPEQVRAWQAETLAEPAYGRAVRGSALQQAAAVDEDAALRAIERLERAQAAARSVDDVADLSAVDRMELADATLEAAQTALAFQGSKAASTAEGRATARALAQRRQQITARQGFESAARARQVGQDAAFAADVARRAANSGTLSPKDEQILRTLADKLRDAERNGLVGDGAGGRIAAMEQQASPAVVAAVNETQPARGMRSEASRYTTGLGTEIASEVGTILGGTGIGAATGAAANPDDPMTGARYGAVAGAITAFGGRRIAGRRPGLLATFGFSPTPDHPTRSVAMGADPSKRYTFAYRVVDLDDLVTSHTPTGAANPAFPQELQPRDRGRVGSMQQVDRIARDLSPDALLFDAGRLDSGPMIVGPDRIVESGNGRTLALRRAADQYPEQYGRYLESLRGNLSEYGLDESALQGVRRPVLVRERLSEVDRAAFAAEANNAGLLRMSAFEQAAQDANNLSDDLVANLRVGENDNIASALRRTDNREQIRAWVGTLPANEQAGVIDAAGQLSAQGYERITNALLMRTYGADAGERLVRAFVESADPMLRNVQAGLLASLPDVARAEAMIRAGTRDAGLSISGDMAAAVDMLARLRREGVKVADYLAQGSMFQRELTPFQEELLAFLDANNRKPSALKNGLKQYAERVESTADPSQAAMFGDEIAPPTRQELWQSAIRDIDAHAPTAGPLFEADQAAGRVLPDGARLAEPAAAAPAVPQAPAAAAPEPPAVPAARPAPPVRPRAPRPGPVEPIAPRGGPEGRLEVQGAPARVERPGPVADYPSTGGRPLELTADGAPQPTPRPGAPMEAPRGGPEVGTGPRLTADGQIPLEPAPHPGPVQAAPTGGADVGTGARLPESDGQLPLAPPARPGAVGDLSTGGPDGSLTLQSGRTIKDVAAQIDDVLANPTAPDAVQRLRELHQDLQEISAQGFTRSSEIKKRLQKQGLLRAGIASKTDDVDGLVKALANADPSKPEQMQAILKIISKPRLIDKILEYQYVNMLSSPITQGVNILSNLAQITGRLALQNPLEHVFTGGQSSGVRAAVEGTMRGAREAWPEVKQIMRTGVSDKSMERAAELGDYANVRRELLTEQFGRTGALMHVISTRPLQAMDALLGHMAYAGAAEQYAQRTADRLLKNGSEAVKGMSREQARAHVMANIWDYSEIIEKSGKISDYTLLKSNDSKGTGWGNRAEAALRRMVAMGRAEDTDGFTGQAAAFLVNQIMPFFNVPLNAAKQGVERSAGAIYNPIRAVGAARATAAAEKAGDAAGAYANRERFGELAAKGTIAASALTTGAVLAMGDNLTGDGPSDPGKRAVWEQTHKRNSWRVPGTSQWISWEGTPMAVPFGMVAGAKEGWKESQEAAAKKGDSDTGDALAAAGLKTLQGGFSGFASQSFVRALGQQYQLMTGDQTGLGTVAASATGTVSRFMPSSGMVNWLARISDTMERDAGRPQKASDLPENIGARLATRVPGLRQQVDPKLDMYGENAPNEQAGAAGVLPFYRGAGPRAGDPITRAVEASGIGAPRPTEEVTHPRIPGAKVPLQGPKEQRVFQQAYGRAFRRLLEANKAEQGNLTPAQLEKVRGLAREDAVIAVLQAIGPSEVERRLTVGVR